MLSCGVRLSLPSPPSLLLRKQYLSLRELFQSQRDKHCSRSDKYCLRSKREGAYPLKCKHALKHHTAWYRRLDEHRHSDSNAPVKTANPPP